MFAVSRGSLWRRMRCAITSPTPLRASSVAVVPRRSWKALGGWVRLADSVLPQRRCRHRDPHPVDPRLQVGRCGGGESTTGGIAPGPSVDPAGGSRPASTRRRPGSRRRRPGALDRTRIEGREPLPRPTAWAGVAARHRTGRATSGAGRCLSRQVLHSRSGTTMLWLCQDEEPLAAPGGGGGWRRRPVLRSLVALPDCRCRRDPIRSIPTCRSALPTRLWMFAVSGWWLYRRIRWAITSPTPERASLWSLPTWDLAPEGEARR